MVYISFGGHQRQTIEHIKLYKICTTGNNLMGKIRGLKLYNFSNFCQLLFIFYFFVIRVFIVIKCSTVINQLSTEQ